MRLGAVRQGRATKAFRHDDRGWFYFADVPDVSALLRIDGWEDHPGAYGPAPEESDLVNPLPAARKFLCAGLNYYAHAVEVQKAPPEMPTIFSKVNTALTGPSDEIVIPAITDSVDWEAELAVVVGRRMYRADRATALASIAGYTVINDVSMRDWQRRTSEWFQGKNFDASTPVGPVVVTPDAFDPADGHAIETIVNGVVEQSGSTADLIFSVSDLLVYITQFMTLEPGDVVATGTPSGVGFVRTPPVGLRDGDILETRIAGLGLLRNAVRYTER